MSNWPRLILTEEEKKWCSKYYDPRSKKPAVVRRDYPGTLMLNQFERNPVFPFNVARRVRVYGIDFAGDLEQFRIAINDTTGTQYVVDPLEVSLMAGGEVISTTPGNFVNFDANTQALYPNRGGTRNGTGYPSTPLFEPNIILLPNQTLELTGLETQPAVPCTPDPPTLPQAITPYRIDFTLHVWEFPGMNGGAM